MLNEVTSRRPGFLGGVSIALCDGQEWSFPVCKSRYVKDSTRPTGIRGIFVPPVNEHITTEAYKALVDAEFKAESGVDVIRSQLDIAYALLQINYDLTDDQISELIQFVYGDDSDPDLLMMKDDIMGVAFGQAPKRLKIG